LAVTVKIPHSTFYPPFRNISTFLNSTFYFPHSAIPHFTNDIQQPLTVSLMGHGICHGSGDD